MRHCNYISTFIVIIMLTSTQIYAQEYWTNYAKNLKREQKHIENQPYIAPFVTEYLDTRIAMAHQLYTSFTTIKQDTTESRTHLLTYAKALSLCTDKYFIDITKEQISKELQYTDISSNDCIIIHTELVLASFFKNFDTMVAESQSNPQYDQYIKKCQPPFDDVYQSLRFQELAAQINFIKQQQHYIASIASLCNVTQYDEAHIRRKPELIVSLLSQLEHTILTVPERSAAYNTAPGIPYQITIPQKMDCAHAIATIQNKRDAIVTGKDSSPPGDITSIALQYITPIQHQIAEQQKLLAIMKSTDGIAIENEEAFKNFTQHFEMQSMYLRNYADATTLYCQFMVLQPPRINYANRCQHITRIATHIQKVVQSLGSSSKEIIPIVKQLFEILKAFLYVDVPKEDTPERGSTVQTLHTIKEEIYALAYPTKDTAPGSHLCNLEIAMNIETLEKGITLFNSQTYAKQALMRYASILHKAFESAHTGFSDDTLEHIIAMQSAIPVVKDFDVQQIVNEYTSQQYLLRKLRSDSASLMQRIEAYKKKGIVIHHYEKAKAIAETIKNLQPLYTVDVGRYKMNQNNIIVIDRQCAALLKHLLKNNRKSGKI